MKEQLIEDLRLAKTQLVMRAAQLSACRVCAADHQRYEAATQRLNRFIHDLEHGNVQILESQP